MTPVGKINSAVGAPTVHTWGRLRLQANGGSLAEEQLYRHPKVRSLVSTFLGADQTYYLPANPGSIAGKNRSEAAAQRLAERTAEQVALGCDESSLAFFIQKFGEFGGNQAFTTPDLFRSQDDAAGVADAGDNWNAIYTDKAENGPLTVQSVLSPVGTISALLRDLCKTELEARSLTAWGHWLGDTEFYHEPWNWCKSSGGTWTDMENDARAGTETIVSGSHFITGSSPGDLTLDDWITRALTRTATFAPNPNVNWSSGANASTGSHKEMTRLWMEASMSQYARMTKDIWSTESFYTGVKYYNYIFSLFNNPAYPVTTFEGGGSGDVDHIVEFFGMDGSSPTLYPYNLSNGDLSPFLARFGPATARYGPGRGYDERRGFNNAKRMMNAIAKSSVSAPIFPWIRGSENPTSLRNPKHTAADMAAMIRLCASYPTCLNVILWYNNNPAQATPDHDTMLAAVELMYPQYVWSGTDWEAA